MLSPEENDNAWHGGCLALAELGIFFNSYNFISLTDTFTIELCLIMF